MNVLMRKLKIDNFIPLSFDRVFKYMSCEEDFKEHQTNIELG